MTRVPREKMQNKTIFLREGQGMHGLEMLGLDGSCGPFEGQLCLD